MDQLKLKHQQELIASINKGTTPGFIKNKNKNSGLVLDNCIIRHINVKKSRYEILNNKVNDEMINQYDKTDAKKMKDQVLKVFHTKEIEVQEPKVFHSNEMDPKMSKMTVFLPNEILQEIFKYECQDIRFLHSCILVNKSWSINAIQLLWNRPFYLLLLNYNKPYSHQIIATYKLCTENNATFEYHRYLRHLSFFSFLMSIQKWSILYEDDALALQAAKELFSFFSSFTSVLDTLDFTIEVDNVEFKDIKLRHWNLLNSTVFKSMIFILIQNTNVLQWFSNVNEIILDGDVSKEYDFFMLLHFCNNIKTLKVKIPYYNISEVNKICQLIKLQNNLESVTIFESEFHYYIISALMSQKSSLRFIEFTKTSIVRMDSLDWIAQCVNLESLKFSDTDVLPWLFRNEQVKLEGLKYLVIEVNNCVHHFDFITSVIKSSNAKLQVIKLKWPKNSEQLVHSIILESISFHCTNLTELGVAVGKEEFTALMHILKNCKKLKILKVYGDSSKIDVSNILPELGLNLSHNFEELIIKANWIFCHNSLLKFFENSQHIKLYKFAVKICDFITDKHFVILKGHSTKSLKYITFKDKMFANTEVGLMNACRWLKMGKC